MAMAANVDGLLIPGLPDDITLQCIARLPLSTHRALSHVSRSWRSVVRSPSLYSLRSDLGNTELILIVQLFLRPSQHVWFELHPNDCSFPIPEPPISKGSGVFDIGVGHRLFLIGGSGRPSSGVHIYDSRTRSWSRGPTMSLPRQFPTAGLINGRIVVAGGCQRTSWAWAESLDPTDPSACWTPITIPDRPNKLMHRNYVLNDMMVMVEECDGTFVFDPANAALGPLRVRRNLQHWWCASEAVVGGVIYRCVVGEGISAYIPPPIDGWMKVEGELPDYKKDMLLVDFGGLMCIVWKEDGEEAAEICCAAIDISQTEVGRFRSSVVWFNNNLLKVPKKSYISNCVVLEL